MKRERGSEERCKKGIREKKKEKKNKETWEESRNKW